MADELKNACVSFKGKTYPLVLTSANHRRIKDMTGVSLPDAICDVHGGRSAEDAKRMLDGFYKLLSDFDKLPAIVYAWLKPLLHENGVSEEQFHNDFDGDFAIDCGEAITSALINFSQKGQQGKMLASAVKMAKKAEEVQNRWNEKANAEVEKKIDQAKEALTDEKVAEFVAGMIQETLTNSSTTLPASLVSTLGLSRSEG